MRIAHVFASAAVFAGLVLACSNERIVLATVPDEEDGGSQPIKCATNADCPATTFCDKHHCDSPGGFCAHYPTVCPNSQDPHCGCDGVTYFNDCLRQAAEISGADDGECINRAATCDSNGQGCLSGQSCSQLGPFGDPSSCHSIGGRCWVLPSTCPGPGDDRWDECSTAPDALRCQDSCNAIRSGKAFVRAHEQCP